MVGTIQPTVLYDTASHFVQRTGSGLFQKETISFGNIGESKVSQKALITDEELEKYQKIVQESTKSKLLLSTIFVSAQYLAGKMANADYESFISASNDLIETDLDLFPNKYTYDGVQDDLKCIKQITDSWCNDYKYESFLEQKQAMAEVIKVYFNTVAPNN